MYTLTNIQRTCNKFAELQHFIDQHKLATTVILLVSPNLGVTVCVATILKSEINSYPVINLMIYIDQ